MRTALLSMAVGIAAVAWFPRLLPLWLLFALGAFGLVLGSLCSGRAARAFRCGIALATLALGICWGNGYGYYIRAGLLPAEFEQQTLLVRGRVVGLVERQSGFQQRGVLHFQFALDADAHHVAPWPRLIQLNWYNTDAVLQAGEQWQLRVKLKRPRGFANPGGFDYEAWLVANRIGATGYIERSSDNQKLGDAVRWSIDALRGRAQNYLLQRLQHFSHRDLLLGLLVGDGGAIADSEWATFRATGTVHLFVVSGLQIAFTGGVVLWCLRWCWRGPFIASRARNFFIAAVPAWLAACVYALLAGWGLPMQRALIMFSVLLWALIARRSLQASTSWLLALWLVLLFDPLAVNDIGFWFSFMVVAAILLAVSAQRESPRSPRLHQALQWWRVQWAIFAVSLPVLLQLSGQITALALPANLIAIPLSTLITLPLAFIGLLADFALPRYSEFAWLGADRSLEWLWQYLLWLQQHGEFAIWQTRGVSLFAWWFGVVAVALLLLPRALPGKAFALFLLLPLCAPALDEIAPGDCTVTVIDVGQGLSVLIETAQHRLLYDTGPLFGPERTVAELTLAPLLRQRGIGVLDTLIISHHDSDHAGGRATVEREFAVQQILVGEAIDGSGAELCAAGMHWRWDNVDFEILHPDVGNAANFAGNNRSCVLQIAAGDTHILLTGDIERDAEYTLLDNPHLSAATLLLAPHHGSRSSSTPAFIERMHPRYVVFSTGYRNRFRHPSPEVETRYRNSGAVPFDTADDGALTFRFRAGREAQITRQRALIRHYWY